MNSKDYLTISKELLHPTAIQMFTGDSLYVVQDNATVHKSKIITEWFESTREINLIKFPAKSPDLNIIENAWAVMQRKWISGEIKSVQQLTYKV